MIFSSISPVLNVTQSNQNIPWPNEQPNEIDFRVIVLWNHHFVLYFYHWWSTTNMITHYQQKCKTILSCGKFAASRNEMSNLETFKVWLCLWFQIFFSKEHDNQALYNTWTHFVQIWICYVKVARIHLKLLGKDTKNWYTVHVILYSRTYL